MSKRDIEAGRAHVTLWVKKSAFAKGLQQAERHLGNVGRGMMKIGAGMVAAGAAIIGTLGLAVTQFIATGDALDKMSARTGIGVAALSELGFAAEQSGQNLDMVEKAVRRMQKTIGDAHRGLSTAVDGLDKLGLSAEQLDGLSPDEQFSLIAERIAEIEDPTKRASAAMDVFGSRTGTALLPMLENMAALREEARQLGLPPTEEQTKRAAALADAINRVKRIVGAAVFQIGDALAPSLLKAADAIQRVAKPMMDWIRDNQEMVRIVAAAGLAITGLGTAITVAGGIILAISAGLGGLVTVISGVATAISTIGLPILAVIGIVGAFYATLAGAVAAWAIFTDSGQAAVGIIRELFGNIVGVGKESIGAIIEALRAGDLEAAMEIAMLAAEVVWLKSLQTLREGWQDFVGKLFIDFVKLVDSIGAYFEEHMLHILAAASNPTKAIADFAAGKVLGGAEAAGEAFAPWFAEDQAAKANIAAKEEELRDRTAPFVARIEAREAMREHRNAEVRAPMVPAELLDDPRAAEVKAPSIPDHVIETENERARFDREAERMRAEFEADMKRLEEQAAARQQQAAFEQPAMDGIRNQVAVSFSAAALGAIGQGGGPQERIAKATADAAAKLEELRKLNEAMLQEQRNGGPAFA